MSNINLAVPLNGCLLVWVFGVICDFQKTGYKKRGICITFWQKLGENCIGKFRSAQVLLVVVGPDRPRPTTLLSPRSNGKPQAATAVDKLLMMGMRVPETCWAVFKRQAINMRDWCIWLVDLFELILVIQSFVLQQWYSFVFNPGSLNWNSFICTALITYG